MEPVTTTTLPASVASRLLDRKSGVEFRRVLFRSRRSRRRSAPSENRGFGVVARVALDGTGNDDDLARERRVEASGPAGLVERQSRGAETRNSLAIVFFAEVPIDGLGDDRTDAVKGFQLFEGRRGEGVEVMKTRRQFTSRDRSDVSDTQAHEEATEGHRRGVRDLSHQRRRRKFTESF